MAQRGTRGDGPTLTRPSFSTSIISDGLRVTGRIECDGAVQIDGFVDGDVVCDDLTIGASGTIRGNVNARTVHVIGAVIGSIQAKNALISSTSRIVGDVIHESLVVEHGARVDGFYRSAADVSVSGTVDVREKIGQAFRSARPPIRTVKQPVRPSALPMPLPARPTAEL